MTQDTRMLRRVRLVMKLACLSCLAVPRFNLNGGLGLLPTPFHGARGQAGLGNSGCDAKQPHKQRTSGPAAKLLAMAEHGGA